MNKAKQALSREIGPLPVWAWLIVIVGGVVIGRMIGKATSGGGVEDGDTTGSPSRIQLPAGYSGGAVGGGISLPNGAAPEVNSTSDEIQTNDAWRSQAVGYLVGAGSPPLGADRALFAYLSGQTLTPEQSDMVNEAITRFGIPPSAPQAPTAESAQPATPEETNGPGTDIVTRGPDFPPRTATPTARPKDRAEAVVFEAYDDILGRTPDAQGLTFWADQIRTGKTSVSQMRNAMADSVEFGEAIATG